jgi:hypothetical protein
MSLSGKTMFISGASASGWRSPARRDGANIALIARP